jgi:hypothetical protein
MSLTRAGKNYAATAMVLIKDQNGAEKGGATVVGDWYLNDVLIQSSASGVTDDATGIATISSPKKKAISNDTFTFRVLDVDLAGYVYTPGATTEGSISVP